MFGTQLVEQADRLLASVAREVPRFREINERMLIREQDEPIAAAGMADAIS